ncbi:DUF4190 domain-containing protein [Actinoplanes sp. ATCC 53533]|uniref:DUF4190 domain-containing protein n=1 Tax=Actinoplanes sp. ATCC 53533 TaxID=1288362 RepID=UPI001315652F|nr:DUF4190 domain-containing protein [Actinoplanes sp. ATCC 53533]
MDHQPAQSLPPGPPPGPPYAGPPYAGPPYAGPPYAGPPTPGPPPWNGKTNGFSIAALTLSLFGCVGLLSVVFGIIGLRQSRRNGDRRGRFFAIAALTICGLWLAVIAVAVVVNLAKGPDRDATGAVRGERSISIEKLRAGDCIKNIIAQTGSYVDVVPCTTGHTSEVIGRITLPAGPWPGQQKIEEAGDAGCEKLLEEYAGRTLAEARSTIVAVTPEELDWPEDRGVLCIAYHLRAATDSLRR